LGRGALPEENAAMCFSGIKSILNGKKNELIFLTVPLIRYVAT
jgi:hypothetical protein